MTTNEETRQGLTGGSQESLAEGGGLASTVPQIDADDIAQLWADAKSLYLANDFPKYASPAWVALHPDDPRRLAAALNAAELWRKYGDEEALLQWFRDVSQRAAYNLASSKTHAELTEARKPRPAHVLRATPGWPPIRIPGGRGRYLTYQQHQEAA